jgi:hypothetical protein
MPETGTLLDIIRLVVGVLILSYASYTDIKTRRASDILWDTKWVQLVDFTSCTILYHWIWRQTHLCSVAR